MEKTYKWKPRVYLAQAMTGQYCDEMVRRAREAQRALEKAGLEVWSPVVEEKVPRKHIRLSPISKEDLMFKWLMDKKEGLAGCHVIYDITADRMSEGVGLECGRMRWYEWKPVLQRKKKGHVLKVTQFEDYTIVHTHKQAALLIKKRFPDRLAWVLFKIEHLLFGVPKFIWRQIKQVIL